MAYERTSVEQAIEEAQKRLSSIDLDGDVSKLIDSLNIALSPVLEKIFNILMNDTPQELPLSKPPPIEIAVLSGFMQDAIVLEEAGRRVKQVIADRKSLDAQRQAFPNNELGDVLKRSVVSLYNLMDIAFPTRGRLNSQNNVRMVEVIIDDDINRMDFLVSRFNKKS